MAAKKIEVCLINMMKNQIINSYTGTPKKGTDQEPSDAVNVDIEGELTKFYHHFNQNQFCVNQEAMMRSLIYAT